VCLGSDSYTSKNSIREIISDDDLNISDKSLVHLRSDRNQGLLFSLYYLFVFLSGKFTELFCNVNHFIQA
jgi:hypothetical protein